MRTARANILRAGGALTLRITALAFVSACADFVLAPDVPPRLIRAIRLDAATVSVDDGQASQLTATVLDQNGIAFDQPPPGTQIRWVSSATDVAAVDASGVVTGARPGGARITASVSGDFGSSSVSADVTVRPVPTAMIAAGGDAQQAEVGQALGQKLRVHITDRHGDGVPNIAVDFVVTSGGGSLDASQATTDATGGASVQWTIGTRAGDNGAEAHTTRLPGALAAFTAVGVHGAVSALVKVSGDAQSADPGATLPAPLVARATDRYGNAIPGTVVDWVVLTGGGSTAPTSSVTDANGDAATRFTLGTATGTQTVRASVGGILEQSYTATATTPVASVDVAPSTVTLASGMTQALTFTAKSADGSVVTGKSAGWSSSDTAVAAVDAGGVVRGARVGTSTITATIDGVPGTATVTVIAGAVTPSASGVSVSAANVVSGSAVTVTVRAKDAAGNDVTTGGRAVTFSTSGGGSTGAFSATTDQGDGTYSASFTGQLAGAATTIGASIDGAPVSTTLPTIAVTPGPASLTTSLVTVSAPTVTVGQTVTLALRMKDAAGNSVTTGGLTVAFTATGGTSAGTIGSTTDNGDGTYSAQFSATADGTPTTIGATIGGNPVTTALPTLQVTPAPPPPPPDTKVLHWIGQSGNWSDVSRWDAGRVPSSQDTALVDNPGTYVVTVDQLATVAKLRVGAASGTVTLADGGFALTASDSIVVAATGALRLDQGTVVTAPVLVNRGLVALTGLADIKASFVNEGTTEITGASSIHGPFDNPGVFTASLPSNETFALTPSSADDLVRSAGSLALLSGRVDFNLVAGEEFRSTGSFSLGTGTILTVRSGEVTIGGTLSGTGTIDVSNTDQRRMHFDGIVRPGGTTPGTQIGTLSVIGGFFSSDHMGNAVEIELAGAESNQYDRLDISGGSTWDSGHLKVSLVNGFTPTPGDVFTILTHSTRGANFDAYELPALDGAWQVRHNNSQLTLTAIGNVSAVSAMSAVAGDAQTVNAGDLVPIAPAVRLTDASGSPVRGIPVGFAVSSGGGSITGDTVLTDVNGVAAVGSWRLGVVAGSNTLTATVNGGVITGNPATFTATGRDPSTAPALIQIADGNNQQAQVETAVFVPPKVLVLDALSRPVAGVTVTFAVIEGGGSVTGASPVTAADGTATVGSWTLGPDAGTNRLTATAAGAGIAGNPVTFTATGTMLRTWTGALSTDWSTAGNWSPAGVPKPGEDAMISPAANQPILTTASAADRVYIGGAGARLTIGGQTLTTGYLVVYSDGVLVMTNTADLVIVNGLAGFQGGNEAGLLTAGELRVSGDFFQGQQTDPRSFLATGTHRVVLTGTVLQSVNIVSDGTQFQDLDISSSVGINIQFNFFGTKVAGTFTSKPGAGPAPLIWGLGRSLTARRFQVDKLTVNKALLTLNELGVGANEQFDNVTFQDSSPNPTYPTRTQLTIIAAGGGGRTLTFNNILFVPLVTGNTGFYLNVTAGGTLTVNLPGANAHVDGTGPAFTAASQLVTVNWP